MTLAWVIGARGLIGSALSRELLSQGRVVFSPAVPLPWRDAALVAEAMRHQVAHFADAAPSHSRWEIYWAAGTGTFRSAANDFDAETAGLQALLDGLAAWDPDVSRRGAFALASSAGALYPPSDDEVVTEHTSVRPSTPYGHAKFDHEQRVVASLAGPLEGAVLLARISTVYGAGQGSAKPQGLISHIARSVIRRRPVSLFVPLDTIRDYLAVDDAAREIVLRLRQGGAPGVGFAQIVAAERPTTISEIVSVFRRVSPRPPSIVISTDPLRSVYPRRVQYRSLYAADPQRGPRTSLVNGISALLAQEQRLFARPGEPGAPN